MSTIGEIGLDTTLSTADLIFEPDEMNLRGIHADWSEEELLNQDCIFFLKDVSTALNVSSATLKQKAKKLKDEGKSAWDIIGIRKTWTHWYVRMMVFSTYYREIRDQRIQRVKPNWDANIMLSKKGRFFLSDVCKKLPFKAYQIRYQIKGNKNHKREFGVWKEPQHKSYLVDMETFSRWIKTTWLANPRTRN